jgi:hypothetical protein
MDLACPVPMASPPKMLEYVRLVSDGFNSVSKGVGAADVVGSAVGAVVTLVTPQ